MGWGGMGREERKEERDGGRRKRPDEDVHFVTTGVCTISSFCGSQHSSNKIKRMIPRFTWISRTKWEEKGKAPGSVADLLTTNQVAHCPIYPVSMPSVFWDLKHPKLIYDQLSRCPPKSNETTGGRSVNRYLLFPLGKQILLSRLNV